jgi:hypothetical protein
VALKYLGKADYAISAGLTSAAGYRYLRVKLSGFALGWQSGNAVFTDRSRSFSGR